LTGVCAGENRSRLDGNIYMGTHGTRPSEWGNFAPAFGRIYADNGHF
jgi:hypothetical protein